MAKKRALREEYFKRLADGGDLKPVMDAAVSFPDFSLNFRDDQGNVTIYYKTHRVLRIGFGSSNLFTVTIKFAVELKNKNWAKDIFAPMPTGAGQSKQSDFQFNMDAAQIAAFPWNKFFMIIMRGIDMVCGRKDGCEKDVQHRMVIENNRIGVSDVTDYFVVDTEYNFLHRDAASRKSNDGRMDAVAVRWPRAERFPTGIAFIEVKAGNGVVGWGDGGNSATITKHYTDTRDYVEYLTDPAHARDGRLLLYDVYRDIERMLYQQYKLGWIKRRKNNEKKHTVDMRYWEKELDADNADAENARYAKWNTPQLIFVLANYDQESDALRDEVYGNDEMRKHNIPCLGQFIDTGKDISDGNVDMRFALSSFMGYGLYDNMRIMPNLVRFCKMFNITKKGVENGNEGKNNQNN